jgi:hypothetical protein
VEVEPQAPANTLVHMLEGMSYEPRRITFLGREGLVKHYGIARGQGEPRPALTDATRRVAADAIPAGAAGFTIAHDAATAALAIVYWWANENELHARYFAAPRDDPGMLAAVQDTGMACVWELEVIDFERRLWLRDVLQEDDLTAYLDRALEQALV